MTSQPMEVKLPKNTETLVLQVDGDVILHINNSSPAGTTDPATAAILAQILAAVTSEGVQMDTLTTDVAALTSAVTDLHTQFDTQTAALIKAQADVKDAQNALAAETAKDDADVATIAAKQADLDTANASAAAAATQIENLTAELKALTNPVTPPVVEPPVNPPVVTDPPVVNPPVDPPVVEQPPVVVDPPVVTQPPVASPLLASKPVYTFSGDTAPTNDVNWPIAIDGASNKPLLTADGATLYFFSGDDLGSQVANGDGVDGVWHVYVGTLTLGS